MPEGIAEKLKTGLTVQDVPDEVTTWLGRLVLLYGLPFQYLVPEEEMLPAESIRFFELDPIWIQCLVQGACSVGSSGYGDTFIDGAMNSLVQPNRPDTAKEASITGKSAAGARDRLRQQMEGVAVPERSEDLEWPLTGFLLRSAVVKGWRGLEFMAYRTLRKDEKKHWEGKSLNDDDKAKLAGGFAPLKALRIEQLSPDVMLGIFNGTLAQLVVRQPQESLHFGLTKEGKSYIKTLRSIGYKNASNAGEILQKSVVNLASQNLMRDPQQAPGVIRIAALAEEMRKQLAALGELKQRFTSAEFAVEMIEAAGQFTFMPKASTARID